VYVPRITCEIDPKISAVYIERKFRIGEGGKERARYVRNKGTRDRSEKDPAGLVGYESAVQE
jgi:hypothetical protein